MSDIPDPEVELVHDLLTDTWVMQEVFTITHIEVYPRQQWNEPDLFILQTKEGAEIVCGEHPIPVFMAEVYVTWPLETPRSERRYTGPAAQKLVNHYTALYRAQQGVPSCT